MDIWVAAGYLDIWIFGYLDISQKIEELVAAGYLDIWIFWYLDISQKMERVSAAGYFSLNGNGFSPTLKFQTYLGNWILNLVKILSIQQERERERTSFIGTSTTGSSAPE